MTVFDCFLAPRVRQSSWDIFPNCIRMGCRVLLPRASRRDTLLDQSTRNFRPSSIPLLTQVETARRNKRSRLAISGTVRKLRPPSRSIASIGRRNSCSSPHMSRGKLSCRTENACPKRERFQIVRQILCVRHGRAINQDRKDREFALKRGRHFQADDNHGFVSPPAGSEDRSKSSQCGPMTTTMMLAFFQVVLQHRLKILAGPYQINVDKHPSFTEGSFKPLANAARIGFRIRAAVADEYAAGHSKDGRGAERRAMASRHFNRSTYILRPWPKL